ncbi:MAG: O-antigen ligase family protein [Hyphomicrobium sp.]
MIAHRHDGDVSNRYGPRSFAHAGALALVWLTMATSGLVFSEPCPTDVLALAVIVVLPVVGLVRMGPEIGLLLLGWVVTAACGLIAATTAADMGRAVTHTLVSLFLSAGAVTIAGFIAIRPEAHLRLVFSGLTVAAVVAAAAGVGGYFGLIPASEMFTKFGRASGTFKDPNVFGPFLVPPMLYMLHLALDRPLRRAFAPLALAGLLALAIFLSFSRGAWINLALALATYVGLAFVTAPSNARRQKIMLLSAFAGGLAAAMIAGAAQIDSVQTLLADRASVAQDYDVGPEGRFGGQQKAMTLILDNPLGVGAQQFAQFHHHEEPHNVYLSMLLNAGWIGGGAYAAIVAMTLMIGFASCLKCSPAQPFQLIAVAALLANAGEGAVIDTDHWRHFYLLIAIVWGIAAAAPIGTFSRRRPRLRRRLAIVPA